MGINPLIFYNLLEQKKINFFTGVPDSLLKQFCLCIDDHVPKTSHIIAANEGNAIAIATGYHLGTSKVPMVYMQNSGLGNAINPLLSLCDPKVYSIPMLLLIGWRGEPNTQDEPQHIKQGEIQIDLLKTLNIPFEIISRDEYNLEKKINNLLNKVVNNNRPGAILVKKGTFDVYKKPFQHFDEKLMTREESLQIILDRLPSNSIIISTTGKTSREIYEIREKSNSSHYQDFLTVGSMGHCSSIAIGLALAKPKRIIICIDGDGAFIMHMGILSLVAKLKPKNYYHILMNNKVHESVGGQSTGSEFINILELARANGYSNIFSNNQPKNLNKDVDKFINIEGPNFLEVNIKPGSRKDLGRPSLSPIQNKKDFMKFVNKKN